MTHPDQPRAVYRRPGFLLFAISGALFALAFFLVSLNRTEEIIYTFEQSFFVAARQTFGYTLAWDTLIAFFASERIFVAAGVPGILCVLAEGWNRRHADYGRSFGFILAVAISSVGVEKLADSVSDSVKRPSPAAVLGEVPASAGIDRDITRPRKNSVIPEKAVVAWVFLALLIRRRLRWSGGLAIALVSAHTASLAVIGHQWLSTLVISWLIGMTLAGLWLFSLVRPLVWVERKSEESFVALFWHHFHRGDFGDSATQRRSVRDHSRARVKSEDRLWHSIISERVVPMLAPGVADYRIEEHPRVIGDTPSRPSRYVRFLVLPGAETLVIKLVRRKRGIFGAPGRVARYEESSRASVLLERLGLPVPRIYWVESRAASTLSLWHLFCSAEQFLVGRPVDRSRPSDVAAAMQLLAQLHSHTGEKWGSVVHAHTRSLSTYLLKWLRPETAYNLDRISRMIGGPGIPREIQDWVWHAIESEFLALIRGRPQLRFRLVHGDVTIRNFLFDQADKANLIDFVTVRYDLFGYEVIKSAVSLTDEAPASVAAAWTAYFEAAGGERWQEFLEQATVVVRSYAIREFAHGRVGLPHPKGDERNIEFANGWFRDLVALGPEVWGASPADTDWPRIMRLRSRINPGVED